MARNPSSVQRSAPREALVLGIETSCDETAAALVVRDTGGRGRILANVVRSQIDQHRLFGGVVPEIAARAHLEVLDYLIDQAFKEAGLSLDSIDAVAATAGPGLIGGLIVGLTTAKSIALARQLPLLAVNHLEAHALTPGLTDGLRPPYLLLLVSGGHTQLLAVKSVGDYVRLGTTLDDALGEAFDKTAKLLGLGFPGGPMVESLAKAGDRARFALPRPMLGRPEPNFSFAGLKTAVRLHVRGLGRVTPGDAADLCASFEAAVVEAVIDRVATAMPIYEATLGNARSGTPALVVAGGVAANTRLRVGLQTLADRRAYRLSVPPANLCTDNAAMVAWAGAERLALGHRDPLDATARARWPLDASSAPLVGSGRLGAKV
jgi:N6-L-threonylcarbamoyladenine synthase